MKPKSWQFRNTVSLLQKWSKDLPRLMGYEEARGAADFPAWQRKARRKLKELLGFWPAKVEKPQSWLLQTEACDGFGREHWVVESPLGDHLFLYRLVPDGMTRPQRKGVPPAIMLALHGHGYYGADPVAGVMKGRFQEGESLKQHNYDYGAQFARRGYLVYCLCQRGFAQRCDVDSPGNGLVVDPSNPGAVPGSSCLDINTRGTLLGTTDIGLRVQDALHLVSWIKSRPGEGRAPIGCVGLSGGGHATQFIAALDTRITAACSQGYFCYWSDQIVDVVHCNCNYVPGLLRHFEQDDVCALICPRPLLVTTADKDGVAPEESFRRAYKGLRRVYQAHGSVKDLEQDIFEGDHEFSGRKAFAFFDKHLR